MFSVLFDTNIYGKIFEDPQGIELIRRITKDTGFIVHNFRLIHNELRKAPKIIPLYNELVAKRVIDESKQVVSLAQAYFQSYKLYEGRQGLTHIINDFKIVACASILGCDIIFSNDEKTMKNPIARKAYALVNLKHGLRTPIFYTYSDLKTRYF